MNARLFVLAIVFALIAALFMAVSAPVEENVFRMTLGGDCSADRATGDLYHIWDPYCITEQGNGSAVSVPEEDRDRGLSDVSPAKTEREDDENTTPATASVNNPLGDPAGNPLADSPYAPGDGPDPSDAEKLKDPAGDSNPSGGEKLKEPDGGSKNQTVNQGKPHKDIGKSPEKEYTNSASDNANSQGKQDCPADKPDTKKDKERTKDHDGPSDQGQKSDQVEIKDKKKK